MPSRITRASRGGPATPSGAAPSGIAVDAAGETAEDSRTRYGIPQSPSLPMVTMRLDEDEANTAALAGNLSMRPRRPPLRPDIHAPTP